MHGSIARGPKTLENLHLSDVQELLPTYYLLLTTYYSRLTTDYLPLATYYYLLLTTYYLRLTTYYLLLEARLPPPWTPTKNARIKLNWNDAR